MCEKIIPPEMVRRLAQASRISLTEEEMERFAGQLSGVLEAFKALDALEVEGVEPSYHPVPPGGGPAGGRGGDLGLGPPGQRGVLG